MGHSTKKLEARAVEKLACEPGMYGDGGGLWLTVRSPTSRSWLFIYLIDAISRRMGLGPYPEVTLAMARELAAEARGLVKAHRAHWPSARRYELRESL
jgi:Arm DNA-binding domain